MVRAWAQDIVPACNAANALGNEAVNAWDSASSAPAARSPIASAHPTSATRLRSCAVASCGDDAGPFNAFVAPASTATASAFTAAIFASDRPAAARTSTAESANRCNGSSSGPPGTAPPEVSGPDPAASWPLNAAINAATEASIAPSACTTAGSVSIPTSSCGGLTKLDASVRPMEPASNHLQAADPRRSVRIH